MSERLNGRGYGAETWGGQSCFHTSLMTRFSRSYKARALKQEMFLFCHLQRKGNMQCFRVCKVHNFPTSQVRRNSFILWRNRILSFLSEKHFLLFSLCKENLENCEPYRLVCRVNRVSRLYFDRLSRVKSFNCVLVHNESPEEENGSVSASLPAADELQHPSDKSVCEPRSRSNFIQSVTETTCRSVTPWCDEESIIAFSP